jgi:hypothetical protein
MPARVVHARREVAHHLAARKLHAFARAQGQFLELEDLGRAAAGLLDVVDGVVHHQALALARGGSQRERQRQAFAQRELFRADGKIADADGRFFAGAYDTQRLLVALLDQRAQRMPRDPRGVRIFQRPAFEALEHPRGVQLGDVVEVVGHRLAHIKAIVGLERIEDGRGQLRVSHQRIEPERPGQARAAAFAGQAAHVLAFVLGPVLHHGQRAGRVLADELADGELRAAEGGKELQRLQGGVEVIAPIQSHIVRQHQGDKTAVDARGQFAQDGNGFFVVTRQRGVQAFAGAAQALHQREFVQAGQRKCQKLLVVKTRVDRGGFRRDVAVAGAVEDVFEGGCGGVRHGARFCHRAPLPES